MNQIKKIKGKNQEKILIKVYNVRKFYFKVDSSIKILSLNLIDYR